jgi:hypothetical protein
MTTAHAELSFHRAADLHAFGMPEDRLARMAARRAFVEMKTCFMNAAAEIEGATGKLLQHKVRLAGEVIELWRLRYAVLGALPRDKASAEMHRQELMQQIESAFPEGGGNTSFVPL